MEYIEIYSTKSEKSKLLKKLKEKNFELVSKDSFSEKWYNPRTEETVILEENNRG